MSDPKSDPKSDFHAAVRVLGRLFSGQETVSDILEGKPPPPPGARKETPAAPPGPCGTCGAEAEADIAKRVITRRDGATVPCPGCLGRK